MAKVLLSDITDYAGDETLQADSQGYAYYEITYVTNTGATASRKIYVDSTVLNLNPEDSVGPRRTEYEVLFLGRRGGVADELTANEVIAMVLNSPEMEEALSEAGEGTLPSPEDIVGAITPEALTTILENNPDVLKAAIEALEFDSLKFKDRGDGSIHDVFIENDSILNETPA